MVRMRGRARPYCPEIWLHLQAQASHQLGPVSRDRRAPETAYPWQFRHTRLPRAVCRELMARWALST